MALSASISNDATTGAPVLTVKSDKRAVSVQVTSAGETATCTGTWPVKVSDSSGHLWTLKSDDGTTAVFTY